MIEAGSCLVHLLQDSMVQKRPECRALLERRSSEVLFCPDSKTRTMLIHFLSKNQNSEDALATDLHTNHLTNSYGTKTLEVIDEVDVFQSSNCFVKRGMFQGLKVIPLY